MLEQQIKKILEDEKNLNVIKLIGTVYAKIYGVGAHETFNEILRKIAERKLPSFESITRTRRKVLHAIKKQK